MANLPSSGLLAVLLERLVDAIRVTGGRDTVPT